MRNRNEFVQLIDRYRLGQAQRLAIGLSLPNDYRAIHATMTLAEGRGKWLRPRWFESRQFGLADSISRACRELATAPANSRLVGDLVQLRADLTRCLATAIGDLTALSGNHARLLMTACVHEPGLWQEDYDGKRAWQPLCEPSLLAELGGVTIIDALPGRDLAAGGRGWPLFPLAHWLMFADRSRTISEKPRLLIQLGNFTELAWLPESDGLDDELPAIRYQRLWGGALERQIVAACRQFGMDASKRDHLGAQGKVQTALVRLWQDAGERSDLARHHLAADMEQELLQQTMEVIQQDKLSLSDALKSFASYVAQGIRKFLERRSSRSNLQLVCGGDLANHGLLLSEINMVIERPWLDPAEINFQPEFLRSSTAAIAGLMHIDQMPLTIPWMTGSEMPRVLGRLTAGSPGNWRRVIMEMGDSRPPVMTLREAI
ncbi:MAG: anhydro-N-acetylmuramic acid kinase [Pirellulaceae bacterium]